MGVHKTSHGAFTVYYAGGGEMLQREDVRFYSAFVTVGALLGIKPIGSNAEHIIALDADAVDDRTDDRAGLR
jgi:hypothetical protein